MFKNKINNSRLLKITYVTLVCVLFVQFFIPSIVNHSYTSARTLYNGSNGFVSPAVGPNHFELNYFNEFSVFVPTSFALFKTFDKVNYELNKILDGQINVPRIYVSKLPKDLDKVSSLKKRKELFIKIILPLILQANERIESDRNLIFSIYNKKLNKEKISPSEWSWINEKFLLYDIDVLNFKELLMRHDIVPPSLALAQSIIESGWGTSRFAKNGNAIFGQWTYKKGSGLVPLMRSPGKSHEIKSFEKLEESVNQYIFNLNYHFAYNNFRDLRGKMRKTNNIDSFLLAGALNKYSQKREAYVKLLRSIMDSNNLYGYDIAKLKDYF